MSDLSLDIAVIGMAGRFPEAPDLGAFWTNLVAGRECVRFFTDEELAASGVPEKVRRDPRYVPARAIVADPDRFDAGLFGIPPAEARTMDPQHRVFLEVAWEALEDAGLDPARSTGAIGVFGGADVNSYALGQLLLWTHDLGSLIGNDKDYLATRVAFKLDLRGPAVTVQTACSTSLVAVALACQSLLAFQSDVALAGGVGLAFPQKAGYLWQEGGILSPDGHCRSFDARARGTVGGDGCGIVVLKRLADALADGDRVRAVIEAAALNNDGAAKVGFTAPSVQGQAEVVATAQAMAGVSPDSIGYVEAHGTGTALGDPVEVAALDLVFRKGTAQRRFCALGSLKSSVGHMNSAAGIGGLVKAILAVENAVIPPSLHFEAPNPRIDFDDSCFFVATEARPWSGHRRAAVSSFGVGGTNAHAILRQAPDREPTDPAREDELVVVSGQDEAAARAAEERLRAFLAAHPEANRGDVAWTLQTGRRELPVRRAFISGASFTEEGKARRVAFLLPGQGSQFPGALRGLYDGEPVFREAFDACARDLPELRAAAFDGERIDETEVTQPLLFALGYAAARLWESVGVAPCALLGHSVGEVLAACLAGVFTLDDALRFVAARGRLVQAAPPGAMLALFEDEAAAHLHPGVDVAAINGPALTVVAGPVGAIDALAAGRRSVRLRTNRAFHSCLLDGVQGPLLDVMRTIPLRAPRVPFVSNVSGTWITPEEATDPAYWARQLRRPVRFADGLAAVLGEADVALLDLGPGATMAGLARRHPAAKGRVVVAAGRRPDEATSDRAAFLAAVGRLWTAGLAIDWRGLHGRRRKVGLPTYPFQRQRYWQGFEVPEAAEGPVYEPVWRGGARRSAPGAAIPGPRVLVHPEPADLLTLGPGEVVVVTSGLSDGFGTPVDPDRAPILAAARVAGQEVRGLRIRVIDAGPETSEEAVQGELAAGTDFLVALHGGRRWTRAWEPLDPGASQAPLDLGDGGTWLVTGGIGQVGLSLAEHLTRRFRARLVLTSRAGLVARSEWDAWLATHAPTDPTAARIRRIKAMEALGARVEVRAADVADQEAMERLVAEAGPIEGVVHAAGIAGNAAFRAIADTRPEHLAAHLRARRDGTRVLERVLPESTKVVLLVGSLSTVVGGVGLFAYAAANAFLEAFATARAGRPGTRWRCVAWDAWGPGGVDAAVAARVFDRVVDLAHVPVVAVSMTPIAARIETRGVATSGVATSGVISQDDTIASQRGSTVHPRPDLDTPYVAPRDEVETLVAGIWADLFGLDRVGVHDNFFALGGDSLLAIQLGTRLTELVGVELPIQELFEQPTVESVARRVAEARGPVDRDALALVESLSDEEVRRMLREMEG